MLNRIIIFRKVINFGKKFLGQKFQKIEFLIILVSLKIFLRSIFRKIQLVFVKITILNFWKHYIIQRMAVFWKILILKKNIFKKC